MWLAPLAASAVNVVGTSAGLSWAAATGPVSGYAVQVSRNGGAYVEEVRVSSTSTRVSGQVGDTLRVRVAAFDTTGRMGSASTASDAITFTQTAPPPPPPPPPVGGDPTGDLDGDGITDALVFNSRSGELSVLLLHSDGTRTWQSVGQPSELGMKPAGYADVDGDGQGDVLWRNAASGANEIWRMNGTSHTTLALPDAAARFRVRAFRDFSGDGRADAFFHDRATGESELWTLDGTGRTAALAVDPAPAGSKLAAVADVDGDGSPDLVWHDAATGALEGWLMNGAAPAATFSLPPAPPDAAASGAGDLDGDGDDDLVWRAKHDGTRTIDAWFMDGMNAPAMGIAKSVMKKRRVRGVVDVTSDGRADIVLVSKHGFTAITVDATGTQNTTGEMQWNTQTVDLDEVPALKRWNFMVLE